MAVFVRSVSIRSLIEKPGNFCELFYFERFTKEQTNIKYERLVVKGAVETLSIFRVKQTGPR